MGKDDLIWLALGVSALVAYHYWSSQLASIPGTGGSPSLNMPTPLSIYPEYSYTATTSMAATPRQNTNNQMMPIPQFASVQGQETQAIIGQCAGAYPGCTALTGDTNLGF